MHWILCIAAILFSLAAGYLVYRADLRRAVPYPWLTASLRTLIFLLVFLLLLAPALTISKNETRKPVIVFLQDNSSSVADALKGDTAAYHRQAQELKDKLGDKYKVVSWMFGADVQTGADQAPYTQTATDIASALARVQDVFGRENLGCVILASDGRYNQGVNPQFQQLSLRAPVYTVALGDSAEQKDLRIARTYANKTVPRNSHFEIRADIIASLCRGYTGQVQLLSNGETVAHADISVSSDHYDRSVSFTVKAGKAGLHHYTLQILPAGDEPNTVNNRKDLYVQVTDEQKQILIAAAAPHPDINAIREALSGSEAYEITIRTGNDLPADLSSYHAIILHNMPTQPAQVSSLKSARKPLWLILGTQTNPALLNQLQDVAVSVNTPVMQDVLPAYNPSFSVFTTPADIRAVADRMPPLSGPSGSVKQVPGADPLFLMRTGNDIPLWWLRQSDLPMAMLAGEGIWRWRLYEFRYFGTHAAMDECIRQTVQFLAADVREQPFRVSLPKYVWADQEAIAFNAYLLNANKEPVNTPEVKLSIKDSSGKPFDYSFERSGNGYRLNAGVLEGGHYSYTATTEYNGKQHRETGKFMVETISLEQMQTGADYALLHAVALKYTGNMVAYPQIGSLYDSISANARIVPVIQTVTESLPLVDWKWYFLLLMVVAVAEWLLRKYWMAQ